MKTVRIPSPARSQGAGPRTPIRRKHRRTLSVGSARSNASGRLTAIIQQNRNMDSFTVSPLASRRSILSDNTEIEEPRRKSWWKKLGENSRDVTELFEDNKIEEPINIIEELDIEVLSQENKNYTMDLPESSDTESINSIVIPQRKLFTQKENLQQKKFGEIIGTRETLAKLHKTNTNGEDKTINIPTRELFQNKQRSKPIFPSALLNISPNKTAADKTKEFTTAEPKAQVRNIFGNRAAKRKNIFTNFIVSESEDEIPDIQPKDFGFQKMLKSRRLSSTSSRAMREPSPASSIATDIEMDDWNMLPSSTMVEHQLEVMMTGKSNKTLPSKVTEESDQLESTQEKSNRSTKARNKSLARDSSEVEECIIEINHEQAGHPNNVLINSTSKNKENLLEEKSNRSPIARNKSHAKDTSKVKEDKMGINHEQTDHPNNASNSYVLKNKENEIEVNKNKLLQETIENQCKDIQSNSHENINQQVDDNNEDDVEINVDINRQVDDNEEKEIEINNDINQQVGSNEENESEINADTNEQIDDKEESAAEINDDINKLVDDDGDKDVEINDDISQQITDNEENDVEMNNDINQEITDNEENEVEMNDDINQQVDDNDENELQNKSEVEIAQEQEDENNEANEIEDQNFNFDLQSESEELNEELHESLDNEELHEDPDVQDQSKSKNVSPELYDEVDNENQEVEDESEEEPQQSEVELNENQEPNESHEIVSDNEGDEQNISQEVEEDTEEQNMSQDVEETEEQNESEVENQEESEAIADSENDELNNSQDNVANDSDNHDTDQIESGQDENSDNEEVETPNVSHDTTGRNRKKNKSLEVILHDSNKHLDSFEVQGRNTSVRKTEMIKSMNIRPSLAPARESTGFSDGATNSSAEGSGWDSHRTTRKTLRQTFGRDFTPRKSLRALVMEKSAKRQTKNEIASVTAKFPQANSTQLPEMSNRYDDDNPEGNENHSNHEVSLRTRQTTLEMYLQNIKKKNTETRLKMEEAARNSLNAPSKDHIFKIPAKPLFARHPKTTTKPKQTKSTLFLGELPAEVIEDMKYKPPKRFQPSNAPWITKRLYKFLETKLESKYDYKARIRAEKLVENIYHFAKDLRRHDVATTDAVDVLKREMARLDVVKTHFEFYEFFHQFMPREVRVKVVPDVVNKISLPKRGVFSDIL